MNNLQPQGPKMPVFTELQGVQESIRTVQLFGTLDTLAIMPNKLSNPFHVSLLGTDAVMLEPNPRPDLFEKPGRRC